MTPEDQHRHLRRRLGDATKPQLSAAVSYLLAEHQPREGRSINCIDCPEHNPVNNPEAFLDLNPSPRLKPGDFQLRPHRRIPEGS